MTNNAKLTLEWLPGTYAVCRLDSHDAIPNWAAPAPLPRIMPLMSLTRTDRELSIVIDERAVPDGVKAERGFVALRIAGTLDFSAVGILSTLTAALAEAKIPVLAISTYDTDVLLIAGTYRQRASKALARVATLK